MKIPLFLLAALALVNTSCAIRFELYPSENYLPSHGFVPVEDFYIDSCQTLSNPTTFGSYITRVGNRHPRYFCYRVNPAIPTPFQRRLGSRLNSTQPASQFYSEPGCHGPLTHQYPEARRPTFPSDKISSIYVVTSDSYFNCTTR
ncbi:LOW QUALITY PROTEIN: hypothetical protein BC938DRAFT_471171 [Jimgerdemannia flammicorona]|uniref:Uncharacterized protein n=1 Tax=Jimgerdemannia flammicorona TaxID=994334 RepID=A0A433QUX6_9FUNG|nr:LOW QUALITY PROTEIN: hypothetical protein BC938DRAFT_471171 [Jimgerdemannia flammicorona]